jgi:hypothetical protein
MATPAQPQVLFTEQQRFTQWWLWLIIAVISGLQWWGFVQQIILRRPFGDHPGPDWMVLLFALLYGTGLPLLLLSFRLTTQVQSDALYIRFTPFHLRPVQIDFAAIRRCQAVRYSPLLDYGGWGIRFGRNGKAYNVSGNLGVLLEYSNGTKLLIGSRQPEQLAVAINGMLSTDSMG